MKATAAILPVLLLGAVLPAQLKLSAIFSEGMVLQRDKPIRIYGRAEPGKAVFVQLASQKRDTTAGTDGAWSVVFDAIKAGKQRLTVTQGKEKIQLRKVYMGEVWLCSGQSNMAWPLRRVLGRHRSAFPPTVLQISPQETLELGLDKLAANSFLLEHGFDTPRTIDASDPLRVSSDIERHGLTFPLMAKPRRGCSSTDVFELRSPGDLALLARIEEPILQERAPGQEYTVDLFCDGQRVIACVPRVRLAAKAGQVYKARVETDPVVVAEATRLAHALQLRGLANVQGFRDGGRFRITDINPRTSGGLPLTTAAGANMPLMSLHLALGRPLEPIEEIALLTMCRYWEEVLREHDDDGSRP